MKRFISIRVWQANIMTIIAFVTGVGVGVSLTMNSLRNTLISVVVVAALVAALSITWREITNRDGELMMRNGNPKHFWFDWK